ncbi:flagellar motor switch protein FliN [Sphingomonas sp. Tas61C01]|uniref:flagellar motor switch protein FliN n=1 Tax=Sphingomonas sp. Tas61C01 TaxID=3458297 RepID=UPI00403EF0EC
MTDPDPFAIAEQESVAFFEEFAEDAAAPPTSAKPVSDLVDLHAVLDVPVRVRAVLGRARMPIGELLRLSAGMVIELDRRVGEPVDIFVNDRLIARGEVVLIDDALGITLTEIVQSER